ncbi:hypothetical protein THIOM_005436 [Candidatus Thiomargarita nelsonii]|uniref:Uncharacterized protein n=1 Tax=Candidatus Thiomargarita nelsonii TaxID=1003181 RepID=A0A0A6P068_9GAMM|nr:hypothetical protein THIOM_005436 [Candidatus Thiomargarita nelsonii]
MLPLMRVRTKFILDVQKLAMLKVEEQNANEDHKFVVELLKSTVLMLLIKRLSRRGGIKSKKI